MEMSNNIFVAILALLMTASAFGGTIAAFEASNNPEQEVIVA